MKIQSYAVAKDFFGRHFELDEPVANVTELKSVLGRQNPAAQALLSRARFAVGDSFIDDNYLLKPDDHVSIIPPSSGG